MHAAPGTAQQEKSQPFVQAASVSLRKQQEMWHSH